MAGNPVHNSGVRIQVAATCNPCAAKNPLNPCSPGHLKAPDADLTLTPGAAEKAYKRLNKNMAKVFALSGQSATKGYQNWQRYNKTPYQSTQHGDRYLNNYGNKVARAYGKFEKSGKMPVGSVLAKDSFTVLKDGQILPGPLFVMEKMKSGFRPDFGNWRYSMILPDGSFVGETGGGTVTMTVCPGLTVLEGSVTVSPADATLPSRMSFCRRVRESRGRDAASIRSSRAPASSS